LPVAVSQVAPEGQPAFEVHLAAQILVAGWQTWPAVPRSQSWSVPHWQNARTPASLPAARPVKVAHVLAESGQSVPLVHAVTHVLRIG
jgi:hypothetical protein